MTAISAEASQPLLITAVGRNSALTTLAALLRTGPDRYQSARIDPLLLLSLDDPSTAIEPPPQSNLVLLAIDAREPISATEQAWLDRASQYPTQIILVTLHTTHPQPGQLALPVAIGLNQIALTTSYPELSTDRLAASIFAVLSPELHLVAARGLPGLRRSFTRDLISRVSFSNATYALASGLPEQLPIVNIPFAAADLLILTKNQAVLVFRIALAHGAEPDFQARILELLPVIGGAFLWRQAARSLVGLMPVWGLIPKIAVAYAGTYTTGVAAQQWFARGEFTSPDQLRRISSEAFAIGRSRAEELIARARTAGTNARVRSVGIWSRLRERLKRRRTRPPSA